MGRAHKKCDRCNEFKRQDKTIIIGNLFYCKHCYAYLNAMKVFMP
jgi:formylmethanofuran dehydrogenase subunit E